VIARAAGGAPERRALVVEDSRAMRLILRRMLHQCGFRVSEAANGREAIDRLLAGERAELIVVDWNMPELDGYEFIKMVRAQRAFDGIRLVMVTTETELHQVARALEAGADEYVMKPFTREVIQDKLALIGFGAGAS
jgi:two-component system chemotaxis response regulator CheY